VHLVLRLTDSGKLYLAQDGCLEVLLVPIMAQRVEKGRGMARSGRRASNTAAAGEHVLQRGAA
jgi:hypothetical protein